jgi:hypothetical protein
MANIAPAAASIRIDCLFTSFSRESDGVNLRRLRPIEGHDTSPAAPNTANSDDNVGNFLTSFAQ